MVRIVLPVLKLGTLAVRTIAKPIASRLKKDAGLHPTFRRFIISIAQAHHRFSTTVQRRIYGRSTDIEIRPLNEERAIQSASDLLGEFFVFSVAGLAVIYEVQRNSRAEARKEEFRKQEAEARKKEAEESAKKMEDMKLRLEEVERLLMRSHWDMFKLWNAKEKQA